MTGLPNRVLCKDRLTLALSVAQHGDHAVGVLSISIDQLDAVKDALGHSLADETVRVVARRLAGDLRDGDTAARFEGNEFAVILTRIEKVGEAVIAVSRVRKALEAPLALMDRISRLPPA